MGASGSIGTNNYQLCNTIYISYDMKTPHAATICERLSVQLQNKGFNLLTSQDTQHILSENPSSKHIKEIVHQVHSIIVCISPNMIRSFHQSREMNEILDRTKNIFYLMTDETYTPWTNAGLQTIVNTHTWFSLKNYEKLINRIN